MQYFRHFVCIAQGLLFPEAGLLLKFDVFPQDKNILSPPQSLFGFHSAQKLRYRAGRAHHSI